MRARYRGTCTDCGAAIRPGDQIKWSRKAGARCADDCGAYDDARLGALEDGACGTNYHEDQADYYSQMEDAYACGL